MSPSKIISSFREKRSEYVWPILLNSGLKLLALLLAFTSFYLRFGLTNDEADKGKSLFFAAFGFELSPFLNVQYIKSFWTSYYPGQSQRRFYLLMLHLAIGIVLSISFATDALSLSYQKGLAAVYCICSAYRLFQTLRDYLQPNFFEMFGWFEVVFKNIIKMLAVRNSLIVFMLKFLPYSMKKL